MIFDNIINLKKYIKINQGFKTVIDFIEQNDLNALPLGKAVINDIVWYNNQEYIGKEDNDRFESHIKYIDIQYIIDGEELIYYSKDLPNINENNEKDCYFTISKNKNVFKLSKNDFMIFFPGELHNPGIKSNNNKIKKIVFKVLY